MECKSEYKGISLQDDDYYIPREVIDYVVDCDKRIRSYHRKLSKISVNSYGRSKLLKQCNINHFDLHYNDKLFSYKYNPNTLSVNMFRDGYDSSGNIPHRISFRGDMSITNIQWLNIHDDGYGYTFVKHRGRDLPAHITFHKNGNIYRKYFILGKDVTTEHIRKKYLESLI